MVNRNLSSPGELEIVKGCGSFQSLPSISRKANWPALYYSAGPTGDNTSSVARSIAFTSSIRYSSAVRLFMPNIE